MEEDKQLILSEEMSNDIIILRQYMPIRIDSNGCWIADVHWKVKGYSYLRRNGKSWRAHRLSWSLLRGKIPKNLFVCHTCDIRDCVNPDHLFLGTALDNGRDKAKKNRSAAGSANGNSKLQSKDVCEIRYMYSRGFSSSILAKMYDVDRTLIWLIIRRKIWKSVK